MVTIAMLSAMPEGTCFASGITQDDRIHPSKVRWAAVRGHDTDWCIYYHYSTMPIEFVIAAGDKMFAEDVIRMLVPCSDEAFSRYRK